MLTPGAQDIKKVTVHFDGDKIEGFSDTAAVNIARQAAAVESTTGADGQEVGITRARADQVDLAACCYFVRAHHLLSCAMKRSALY